MSVQLIMKKSHKYSVLQAKYQTTCVHTISVIIRPVSRYSYFIQDQMSFTNTTHYLAVQINAFICINNIYQRRGRS